MSNSKTLVTLGLMLLCTEEIQAGGAEHQLGSQVSPPSTLRVRSYVKLDKQRAELHSLPPDWQLN